MGRSFSNVIITLALIAAVAYVVLKFVPLEDKVASAVIGIGADVAGEVIADAFQRGRDNERVRQRLRVSELESQLQAEAERGRRLTSENEKWESADNSHRLEIDKLKERNVTLGEYLDGINGSTIDVNPSDCMPRLAAAYIWLRERTDTDNSDNARMPGRGHTGRLANAGAYADSGK